MAPKTRLDPLVKLRGRVEEKAQVVLAEAGRDVAEARQTLAEAEVRMHRETRVAGRACEWEMAEFARAKVVEEVKAAADEVTRAKSREEQARTAYLSAHQSVEVVRRAAERKRGDIVREANTAENKENDSVATLMYSYKR